jgi:putative nucleotidyltransferase with HDIG domain
LKDPRNKEHADNVVLFATKIGEALNFSAAEMSLLREAAYYHDIGKIALTAIESENGPDYRKHPTVGFRILSVSERTMEIAKYVLNHHEHWDGTGYPKGLKGEAIPLLSRIVAIAEHYDNLRRNKEHMLSREEALDALAEKAGTIFDPDIVDAFIDLMSKEPIDP